MTQSAEQTGPANATHQDRAGAVPPLAAVSTPVAAAAEPAGSSVRELLTELAGLEDMLRDGPVCEQQAALTREQEILEELHRRSFEEAVLPDRN
jgi:hypothetical protein